MDSLTIFWALEGLGNPYLSSHAMYSTHSLFHGFRSALLHTCLCPGWLYQSPASQIRWSLQLPAETAPPSMTSRGLFKDSDPATQCQSSTSLHDPFSLESSMFPKSLPPHGRVLHIIEFSCQLKIQLWPPWTSTALCTDSEEALCWLFACVALDLNMFSLL